MEGMSAADVHRKTDPRPGVLALEAAGLTWLAEASGGTPVVPVLNVDTVERDGFLAEPRLASTRPDAAAAEAFGRLLARTHAAGAPGWGAAPAGWEGDGVMGDAPLPLYASVPTEPTEPTEPAQTTPTTRTMPSSWGEFTAADRLLPYLGAARGNGSIDADGEKVVRRLADRLAQGAFDHDQPALVARAGERPGVGAARLHGDLWSGNVLWVPATGAPGSAQEALPDTPGQREARAASGAVGVLIDPAAQGGHAESDLAQLFVFGAPHADRIVAAYDEVSPLAGGLSAAARRRGLHQLHILIVHAALFGGGYGARTVEVARGYL